MNRLFRTPASTTDAGANNPPMLEWLIQTHTSNRGIMWKRAMWLGVALLVGCDDQPTPSTGIDSPAFSRVTVTDPTTVLTVGVNAPANLTLKGTVAAIVIAVDNAVVDLSAATLDCSGQTGPDPKIGLWIKGNRSHAYVKGGGTGVIQNCGIGVLIGPLDPQSAEPGGSNNQVAGLKILAAQAILVSNSHGNLITSNTIPLGGPFGIADFGISVVGKDASAAVSGKNQIVNNTVAAGEISIYVSSEGNTVRGNVAAGEATAGIVVDRDVNAIAGNQTTGLPGQDPPNFGIQLRQGADSNTVTNNTLRALVNGIDLQQGALDNIIRGNTAIANGVDAKDENGNCVDNVWANNTFRNSDPLCIVGITLAAVTFTSPTAVQFDGPGATFNA